MWSWKPFHCITISPIPSWFVSWTLRLRRRMSLIQWKLFWPFDLPWKFFVFLRSGQDMWFGATSERVLTFEISFLNVLQLARSDHAWWFFGKIIGGAWGLIGRYIRAGAIHDNNHCRKSRKKTRKGHAWSDGSGCTCLRCIASALHCSCPWITWKLFNKTLPQSCRLRMYFQQSTLRTYGDQLISNVLPNRSKSDSRKTLPKSCRPRMYFQQSTLSTYGDQLISNFLPNRTKSDSRKTLPKSCRPRLYFQQSTLSTYGDQLISNALPNRTKSDSGKTLPKSCRPRMYTRLRL